MRNVICGLFLLLTLVGCGGPNGAVNVNELNAIRNLASMLIPSATQSTQSLNLSNLSSVLNDAASNPQLTSAQSEALSDPNNQAALQSFLQLVQGGSAEVQRSAASNLTAASGGTSNIAGTLGSILQVLQEIAPIISAFDPAIAPFVAIAEAFLPFIESFFGQSSTVAAAGH
jgi:hypothetical protein